MNHLILYGAGLNLENAVETFLQQGRTPTCIVDRSPKKHGQIKKYKGLSLEIMNLETANKRFPNSDFFITPNAPTKFEIMEFLLGWGLTTDRILNFQPYAKIRTCNQRNRVILEETALYLCCKSSHNQKRPKISVSNKENEQLLAEYFTLSTKTFQDLRNHEETDFCQNCSDIFESYMAIDETQNIETLGFDTGFICNYNCCYCSAYRLQSTEQRLNQTNRMLDFAKYLYQNGIIGQNTDISIANGELSINPLLTEILDTFRQSNLTLFTNGQLYSKEIEEILKLGKSTINISLDAGTPQTFKAIKNKNGTADFDIVCQNIRRYAKYAPIELKYILMIGKNDSTDDICGFLDFAQSCPNVKCVILSHDFFGLTDFEADIDKIVEKLRYFVEQTHKRGLYMVSMMYSENMARIVKKLLTNGVK
ncbi:MAG: radical SAM protein [Turicibacter sp.]|nr:radical SAM protein [Turicibacter sp.]